MFTAETVAEITEAAKHLGIEPAALLAVAEVESGGQAFSLVDGRREPLICFEAHYFDRRLSEENRALAREKGLASPVAGAIANPPTQAERWALLRRAAAIDARAAYESVSWGLGQVMGAHWAWLGYASVDAMVAEARQSVAGQARLMALYIDKADLAEALRDHGWQAFARGYNGPGYKANAYDEKIAAAYDRYTGRPGAKPAVLQRGSRGEAVLALQRDLAALGYRLDADGAYGPGTAEAVRRFQADHRLPADGIAGPQTQAAVAKALAAWPGIVRRWWKRLLAWLKALFGRRG
jgi:hypothetical protein